MWALRPSYYDNDMPIDLRKKVVLQRDLEEQKESREAENPYVAKDYSLNPHRERWQQPALLPVGNLYPFMSERYRVRCSLVNAEDSTEKVQPPELRPASRGILETTIQKLHFSSKLKEVTENTKERCRSTDTVLENTGKAELENKKEPARSNSCPDLSNLSQNSSQSDHYSSNSPPVETVSYEQKINSVNSNFPLIHDDHLSSPIIGGAKKRKSFIPIYGDRAPSPKRRPKSPHEQPPYEDYFSHPEILLRKQLQQQSTSPYLLHVYDYYQHLVQRLREHSSANIRLHPPVSPTPTDEDLVPDAQRKRPCRALTGKHVRQGTGASLSTLLTLRQKIQERQKAREHQPRSILNGTNPKNSCPKKNNSKKAKQNVKATLSKIQNC